jgi:hypothetical protein
LRNSTASLDLAAAPSLVVLELATRRVECIAYRDVCIFVGVIEWMVVSNDNLFVRNGDIDPDLVERALLLVLSRTFDPNPAAQNVRTEALETRRELPDARAQRR